MGAASGDHTGWPALGQRTLTACGLLMCDGRKKKAPEGAFWMEAVCSNRGIAFAGEQHLQRLQGLQVFGGNSLEAVRDQGVRRGGAPECHGEVFGLRPFA